MRGDKKTAKILNNLLAAEKMSTRTLANLSNTNCGTIGSLLKEAIKKGIIHREVKKNTGFYMVIDAEAVKNYIRTLQQK